MSKKKFKVYWKESRGIIGSLVLVAAILPVLLWGVFNSQQLNLQAKGTKSSALRIWFEPAELVMKVGQVGNFEVLAESDLPYVAISDLKVHIETTSGLKSSENSLSFSKGFMGRVKLGSVKVTAVKKGVQYVTVPGNMNISHLPNLLIESSAAKVWVK